jgi:hypothetical protein
LRSEERETVDHLPAASLTNEAVEYGCELTSSAVAPNCHAFATSPEQSAPYLPECEQDGQLPEHEPLLLDVAPVGSHAPPPQ